MQRFSNILGGSTDCEPIDCGGLEVVNADGMVEGKFILTRLEIEGAFLGARSLGQKLACAQFSEVTRSR